jgi:archaemetzincin
MAIGKTARLSPVLRAALVPDGDFEPVPRPHTNDWLAQFEEEGQTFREFLATDRNRPDSVRNVIYLQPLGKAGECEAMSLEELRKFASAFFRMTVKILEPIDISPETVTRRNNPFTRDEQLLAPDILVILRRVLPADAFAIMGITMTDLYPDPDWNFCFGLASFKERVGVYSFARYNPAINSGESHEERNRILLERSCKILAHEGLHMFGIKHCIYLRCVVNGCNHLEEFDSSPMHLCPVDLRKLQHTQKFSIVEYYRNLYDTCNAIGICEEAVWLKKRLEKLQAIQK